MTIRAITILALLLTASAAHGDDDTEYRRQGWVFNVTSTVAQDWDSIEIEKNFSKGELTVTITLDYSVKIPPYDKCKWTPTTYDVSISSAAGTTTKTFTVGKTAKMTGKVHGPVTLTAGVGLRDGEKTGCLFTVIAKGWYSPDAAKE